MSKENFKGRDIISINDLTKNDILHILKTAESLEKKPQPKLLKGKIMGSLFFEPSTRTRLSFESAIYRIGGRVLSTAEGSSTATSKGETIWDSIKMIEQYVDIITIRHSVEGTARLAAEAASIPVINAGDGANQHPTQTLLDLYTIRKTKKKLDNLHIGFLGDLKYGRTVHSLAIALSHFNTKMTFISPKALSMPSYYIEELKQKKISLKETEDLMEACHDLVFQHMVFLALVLG